LIDVLVRHSSQPKIYTRWEGKEEGKGRKKGKGRGRIRETAKSRSASRRTILLFF
jgi:hypothetical protein